MRARRGRKSWKLEGLQSDNRMLDAVAARAAELKAEVSRLQHDLVSGMSDLQESNAEISEGVKEREKEKGVELDAVEKERDLLLAKVGKLKKDESKLKGESECKEKEIRILKKNFEELELVLENNKVLEELRSGFKKKVKQLTGKINTLKL